VADESANEIQADAIVHTRLDSALVDIFAASPGVPCVTIWARGACVGAVQIDAWRQCSTAAIVDEALVDIVAADRAVAREPVRTRPTYVRPWNIRAIRERVATTVVCRALIDVNTIETFTNVTIEAAAGVVPLAVQFKSPRVEVALGASLASFSDARAVIDVPPARVDIASAVINVR
jgi:hypothetical protein